jgi:hypothetical protein
MLSHLCTDGVDHNFVAVYKFRLLNTKRPHPILTG